MDLPAFRKSRGLTQEQFAGQLGLSSKGHLANLENGKAPWPLRLALEVEFETQGEVRAVELLEELTPTDAQLLRRAIARGLPAMAAVPA